MYVLHMCTAFVMYVMCHGCMCVYLGRFGFVCRYPGVFNTIGVGHGVLPIFLCFFCAYLGWFSCKHAHFGIPIIMYYKKLHWE